MCVKLSSGDLNLDPYPSHPTSTYYFISLFMFLNYMTCIH